MSTSPTAAPLDHRQAVDDAVLAYVQWREECAQVWEAYGRWASAIADDKVPARSAYWAALDREEAAANFYAKLVESAADLLKAELARPEAQLGPDAVDKRLGAD
jgi:hypothetical protein